MSKPRIQVNVAELEPHPACAAFPMLSDGELDKLAADIKANGQRHPIIIYSGWKILDGRNRLEACRRAGVEPVFHDVINEFESGDDDEIVRYVISTNLHRRHLNESQRADVAAKLETMKHGGVRGQDADLHLEMTREKVAELLNVSPRLVASQAKVRKADPELADRVASGEIRTGKAESILRDRERPRPAVQAEPSRISADEITREGKAFARKARANIDPDEWREWLATYVTYLENML